MISPHNLESMEERTRRIFDKELKRMVDELRKRGKSSFDLGRKFDFPADMIRRLWILGKEQVYWRRNQVKLELNGGGARSTCFVD